jgi:hypothetical protein
VKPSAPGRLLKTREYRVSVLRSKRSRRRARAAVLEQETGGPGALF